MGAIAVSGPVLGIVGFLVFLVLSLTTGMPMAFAVTLVGIVGLTIVAGPGSMGVVAANGLYSDLVDYNWVAVPLFILMGNLAYHGGVAEDAFKIGRAWMGRLPGGLLSGVVIAQAFFGACSGSTNAAAALFTKASLPELRKNKYDDGFSGGTIALSGTLASIIPPSMVLLIYAVLTEQSVGKLLVAGVIPGVLLAFFFIVTITTVSLLRPSLAPPMRGITWNERALSLRGLWSVAFLVAAAMGGIYFGLATPTEAGALGAFAAFVIAIGRRRLSLAQFWESLRSTGETCAVVFLLVAGVFVFARFWAYTELPTAMSQWLLDLPLSNLAKVAGIMVVYFILGAPLPSTPMMILTLPLFYPAIVAMGYSGVWFGILVALQCEMAQATPPIGINVFVVKSCAPDIPIGSMFNWAMLFVIPSLVVMLLVMFFPEIATFLPSLMGG